jgi:hypothetical protein
MRRIVIFVLTITFSLGLADWGIAGPFGLTMGMKLSEFKGLKLARKEPGSYKTKEVPKPHNAFPDYLLLFGPKTGLCKVVALGKVVATSVYGTELRSAFDTLEERLKAQYGKNERLDYLREGSIWNEPKDFMTALFKKERVLASYWSAKEGSRMKDELKTIELEVHPLSEENTFMIVSYDFQNITECLKELNAVEDYAL